MWDFLDNPELQEITKIFMKKAALFQVYVMAIVAYLMYDFQTAND